MEKERIAQLLKYWISKDQTIKITQKERIEINKVIDKYPEEISKIAVLYSDLGLGISMLIEEINNNNLKKIIKNINNIYESTDNKNIYETKRKNFLAGLEREYEVLSNLNKALNRPKENIKKFTQEEKIHLLKHWFLYYCKIPISIFEIKTIYQLIQDYPNEVMNVALANYCIGKGSTSLVNAYRAKKLNNLFKLASESIATLSKEESKKIEQDFFKVIQTSCKYPKKTENLPVGENLPSIEKIAEKQELARKVENIFTDSLLKSSEVSKDKALTPYIIVEGINTIAIFSADKINAHKQEIYNLIDKLPNIDYKEKFQNLCYTKDGVQWTNECYIVEQLMLLGLASNILVYTIPREYWIVNNNLPLLTRDTSQKEKIVTGNNPDFYKKDLQKMKQKYEKPKK